MENTDKIMNQYEALVKHPYIERQKKAFLLLNNAEPETVETFYDCVGYC